MDFTVVVPCAARPASTRAAPPRRSFAWTVAEFSRLHTLDDRRLFRDLDAGTHALELEDGTEPVLEDTLHDDRVAACQGQIRGHLRLGIGRIPRERQCANVSRPVVWNALDDDSIIALDLDDRAGLSQLGDDRPDVTGIDTRRWSPRPA